MDPKAYWVGFNLVKGVGAVRLQGLLDHFGDLSRAWQAPRDALRAAGLPPLSVERLLQVRRQVDLEKLWARIEKMGIRVLIWEDPEYPPLLKEIDQPPPVLYVRGEILPEDQWAVAVVGTRRVTAYGRQVTEEIAAFLAHNGITVVSGLARGTDAIAHQNALKHGGRTIAVRGSGVARISPPEHTRLAEEIITRGAVISDYPPGTPPESTNFPPRNRIVSGLSRATIVVEAGETSGALITAAFAANQGRDVLSVPGSIYAVQSKGTNRLIYNGARPLLNMSDILDVLQLERRQAQQAVRKVIPGDAVEAKLVSLLSEEPKHVDELCVESGLPVSEVTATLTLMELKGLARQVGGMNYVMAREDRADYWIEHHA